MPIALTFPNAVNELNSWSFTATLTKDDGTALGPTALETLTLTLYDWKTRDDPPTFGIINELDHEDILNASRGTLDAAGHLVVSLESDDNPLIGTGPTEVHKALIIGTWNSGNGYTSLEITFTVTNITKAP